MWTVDLPSNLNYCMLNEKIDLFFIHRSFGTLHASPVHWSRRFQNWNSELHAGQFSTQVFGRFFGQCFVKVLGQLLCQFLG